MQKKELINAILQAVKNANLKGDDVEYDKLLAYFTIHHNINKRTLRENYVDPLITLGYLIKKGNIVCYVEKEVEL